MELQYVLRDVMSDLDKTAGYATFKASDYSEGGIVDDMVLDIGEVEADFEFEAMDKPTQYILKLHNDESTYEIWFGGSEHAEEFAKRFLNYIARVENNE